MDRHLRGIAEAVEQLKSAQPQQATLAGTAASRVESIVAAAEGSAREIEEKARAEAQAIHAQAERDAAERVKRAEEMVDRLFTRAQELQQEMGAVVASVGGLKTAVDTVRSDFDAAAPARAAAGAQAPPAPPPQAKPAPAPVRQPPAPVAQQPAAKAEADAGDGGTASEGARLIALNMALSGSPREETARYLRENFDLDDQDELLDDVYARAGS